MHRTLELFVIPAGKPAGTPPEPGPDVELEAASDDAFLGAAHEAITKRGLRARAVLFTLTGLVAYAEADAVTTPDTIRDAETSTLRTCARRWSDAITLEGRRRSSRRTHSAPKLICDDGSVLTHSTLILEYAERLAREDDPGARSFVRRDLGAFQCTQGLLGLSLATCEKRCSRSTSRTFAPRISVTRRGSSA